MAVHLRLLALHLLASCKTASAATVGQGITQCCLFPAIQGVRSGAEGDFGRNWATCQVRAEEVRRALLFRLLLSFPRLVLHRVTAIARQRCPKLTL